MQDQQVGDASVLGEGQTERWFGLAAWLSVAVHTVDMSVHTVDVGINSIDVSVNAIYSIRDCVYWKDKFAMD